MTRNAFDVLAFLLRQIWRFFNSWYIPGTNVTPAGFMLLVLFLALVIRFIKRITFTHHTEGGE